MARREIKADVNELQAAVDDIVGRMGVIERFGKAADHIEGLADIETSHFGIAVSTAEGKVVTGGEAEQSFPIQSISKVFALTLALREFGDKVWDRVGREPSGDPFNSVVDLERHKGIPRNPFINPGAIVVVDMLMDIPKKSDTPKTVKEFLSSEIGEDVDVDRAIYDKESSSGFNNRAMANMCKAFDNLTHEVEAVMKPYVAQCALSLSCRQLALAGRYLMNGGHDPDEHVRARRVNSLMLTCGQYDGSGDFAFRVGLPAKSGVGGGILAIAPGIASIAVWSPTLDENGNSLLGTLALEQLAERMGWSVFG